MPTLTTTTTQTTTTPITFSNTSLQT